jgi:hypothetical protein
MRTNIRQLYSSQIYKKDIYTLCTVMQGFSEGLMNPNPGVPLFDLLGALIPGARFQTLKRQLRYHREKAPKKIS